VKVRQSTVKDCLRSMQFSIEAKTFHGGSVRAVGTGYHAGLELLYGARAAGLVLPTLDEVIAHGRSVFDDTASLTPSHATEREREPGHFKWNKTIPDTETAHESIGLMLTSYFNTPDAIYPDDWTVLGVEVPFELPFAYGDTRNGSMDLAVLAPDGGVVVDDQKTAGKRWPENKHKPRKAHQASWYVSAARQLWPDAPYYRFVFSIMTYKGQFERRVSDPEPRHEAAADQLLFDHVALYKVAKANGLDLPANPSSNLCSPEYCDWWDVCPFGQALDS
jgi:hypothetical protein